MMFNCSSPMDSELYEAASMGDLEFITRLRSDNLMYIGHLTPLNNTVLHIAVTFGQKEFAAKLLELYPSFLGLMNGDGNTPLHVAAKIGCSEIAQLLISSGRDPGWHDKLTCSNQNILRTMNNSGDTALHIAVRNGHFDVVELLITEDIELSNLANLAGETPVFLAVEGGFFDIARRILRASPTAPPSKGTHGMTALHAALIRTHCGRELEYHVPDLSLENIRRSIRDFLLNIHGHFGGFQTQQIDIIKDLLEKWPEMVKDVDGQKWTPLHYAAHLGHLEATQYLIQVERSVAYLQTVEGMSPFHLAAKAGHINVMDELINHCPDVGELLDNKGRTALHLAVVNGKAKVIKFTLKRKKLEDLINFPDYNGNTPLHLAAFYGKYNILMTLTNDQRVDKKVVNKDHLKAIDVIQSNMSIGELKKTRIMKKMEQAGGRQSLRRVISEDRDIQELRLEAEGKVEKVKEFTNSEHDLSPHLYCSSRALDDITTTSTNSSSNMKDVRLQDRYYRLREISGTHLIVAVLIATVTFTGGFTVPGGYKDQGASQGTAVLTSKVAFKIFLTANSFAFFCSTASAFIHFVLSLEENYHLLLRLMKSAAALTYISILSLGIAFTSGMFAILPECSGFSRAILVLGCCFLGFCLFGFI